MEPMGTTTCALFLIIFLSASPFSSQGNVQLAPALYIFGDSTVDGGNNVPDNKAFGIDLNNPSVPPRCTNGLTIADFFATFLGLPLAPPYKNMSEAGTSKSGVNYGSAGCGILPQTGGKTVGGTYCWSFDEQISYYNSTVFDNLTSSFTQEQLVHHLDKSVFLVSFGIDDFNINYLQPNNGTLKTLTPDVFAQFLLNELSARLRTLYLMGGRKFLVNNIWPLGCNPGYSSASCCNETINKLLFPYNDNLPAVLMKLQAELHGSFFSCSNDFQFVSDLKSNVTQYGISNTTAACLSNFWNGIPIPCQNRDEYLYFDGVHTTQAANNIFALNCFNGSICSPNMITLLGA